MRLKTNLFLFAALFATAASAGCGDDGDDDDDDVVVDAGDDDDDDVDAAAPACAEFDAPAGSIAAYPGSFDGDLMGKGSNITVAETVCEDERFYFAPVGEDEVVELTGLTIGSAYVITLTSAEDLSFYVATACDESAGGPGNGDCLLFDDELASSPEVAEFRATETSAFVVVDNWSANLLADGTYTLDVVEAECVTNDDCEAPTPACLDYACVECAGYFDCEGGEPACDFETSTCTTGFDMCTDDDDNEQDDGPLAATPVPMPTLVTPQTIIGGICTTPASESDWYSLDVPGGGRLQASLAWTGTEDLDVVLFDAEGVAVAVAAGSSNPERFAAFDLAAGTYFVLVYQYLPDDVAASLTYTLTLSIPECQTAFDCGVATEPVCDGATNTCVAGVNSCTTDDDVAETAGDDGPAGATPIVVAPGATVEADSSICSQPTTELDYFQVGVVEGEGIAAALSWDGAADLDLFLFDSAGNELGFSYWQSPETVTLTYLPAGTYYLAVQKFSAADPAAVAYTLAVTRTEPLTCEDAADCATDFATQLYRGNCTDDGACAFLDGLGEAGLGEPCDSFDDCASGMCSYMTFESGAETSVCTVACTDTADCTEALGAGHSCTTPFETNFCMPDCTGNTECGANVGSSTLDAKLPWDYLTCTGGACNL